MSWRGEGGAGWGGVGGSKGLAGHTTHTHAAAGWGGGRGGSTGACSVTRPRCPEALEREDVIKFREVQRVDDIYPVF